MNTEYNPYLFILLLGVSAVLFALIPLALKGVAYKPLGAVAVLRRNLLIYGLGGLVVPFVGIKAIDIVITTLKLA